MNFQLNYIGESRVTKDHIIYAIRILMTRPNSQLGPRAAQLLFYLGLYLVMKYMS